MASSFSCGVEEYGESFINPFLIPFADGLESLIAEQNEIETQVKLSCLLQLDDTFTTEDRWPI